MKAVILLQGVETLQHCQKSEIFFVEQAELQQLWQVPLLPSRPAWVQQREAAGLLEEGHLHAHHHQSPLAPPRRRNRVRRESLNIPGVPLVDFTLILND